MEAKFDPNQHDWKPLVPELMVSDIHRSLAFWRDVLGFRVLFERHAEGFAYLEREGSEVMLEEAREGERTWLVGPMEKPFGRGINFQIETNDVQDLLDALKRTNWSLCREPEERWYRTGDQECGQRQFLVQDPDGYLLRFAQGLGVRDKRPPGQPKSDG